jgi:hypothetical protein
VPDISTFLRDLLDACEESKIVSEIKTQVFDNVILKVRIFLKKKNVFIDVFFNSDTDRIAYALIMDNKRIYGADNTGGWHVHPFDNPKEHVKEEEIPFADFLKEVEDIFTKL